MRCLQKTLKECAVLLTLLSTLTPSAASSHPIKASASLVEYDDVKKAIRLECKVFIDDFQRSLMNSVLKGKDPSTVSRKDRPRLVEAYFDKFYSIKHNGTRIRWEVVDLVPLRKQTVLLIKFRQVPLKIKPGDNLHILNTMFFRDFGPAQTNRIAVRIPRFGISDGHVATIRNHVFSYTFKERKR